MSPGKIVTFYSYKGGVGRTMTLANLAWVLAANGRRVLAIDWHLEAPGLHRYFAPFLEDPLLNETTGLIEFLIDYCDRATQLSGNALTQWVAYAANILKHAVPLNWKFPSGGLIDFVAAGRQSAGYSISVNAFNWTTFYERLEGAALLETLKQRLRNSYDYVLIDSSPGISQAAAITTVQMPDDLVVCSNFNRQCVTGSAAVARAARAQSRVRNIRVFPVLMRVNLAEKQLLDIGRTLAWREFDDCLDHLPDRVKYRNDAEFLYKPYYEYVELLAPFVENVQSFGSMLASVERLAFYITDGAVWANLPIPEPERLAGLKAYLGDEAI